jgi:integrase/recombinase XerD
MAITFNLELNNRQTRNKTYVVLLRITQDKKHIRKKTTIELYKKTDFNPRAKYGSWIRSSEPNHEKWNETLRNELESARDEYRKLKGTGLATKEIIKEKINTEEVSPSFLYYAKERTQAIYNEGGYRNYKKYNGFCNKLEDYLTTKRKKDLMFSEITTSFLSKFEAYLHSLNNARNHQAKLHANTISINLRIFKTLINRAIQVDKHITPDQNPFLGFKYDQPRYAAKEKLTQKEIGNIEALDLPKESLIWHVRNYFLFSFYLAGIRAGDLIQLRWSNTADGRLEYRMGKTKKNRNLLCKHSVNPVLFI